MKRWIYLVAGALLISLLGFYFLMNRNKEKEIIILYPFREALFPPEFTAPVFRWYDETNPSGQWNIMLYKKGSDHRYIESVNQTFWKPRLSLWDSVKNEAGLSEVIFQVSRFAGNESGRIKKERVSFRFSSDSVGSPILYREIPLPFAWAELHPDSMSYRLFDAASHIPPHTVMKKFMVCGNCHSYSSDGSTIGLDFDAAHRDKGGYFISKIKDTIVFDTSNYLSWNKIQDTKSFGMFSKLSPDGRYIVTTIKDRVISHNFGLDPEHIAFSQVFFPVNGVLAIYDRQTKTLKELPGANLPEYVQSNAFWTPDGKHIYFARAKSMPYGTDKDYVINDEKIKDDIINERIEFKFDIYSIPFNDGNGGEARPVKGASNNGKSNYFPAISPDGKWMIFCQAENFMLLRPDSRLFIVPSEGGRARKLQCNFPLMNSWHAWSPNGKWMVFVSKGLSIYSDMFLTHIDEKGNASHPILIENARVHGRAANYPEFINVKHDYTFNMIYKYVDIAHIKRALIANDTALATILYNQYVDQGQYALADEYTFLGRFNYERGKYEKALEFFKQAQLKDSTHIESRSLYNMTLSRLKERQ